MDPAADDAPPPGEDRPSTDPPDPVGDDGYATYAAHDVRLVYRPDTNDLDVIREVLDEDAYGLRADPPPPGSLVVDVGAHLGAFAALAASRGARVLAAELDAANFVLLARNTAALPGVVPLRAAVVGRRAPAGYVRAQGNTGGHRLAWELVPGVRRAPAARTLAELLAAHAAPDARVAWLKLDCEGAEHEVLRAAAADGVLARVDRIALETHDFYGDDLGALLGLLAPYFALETRALCPRTALVRGTLRPRRSACAS